MSKQIRRIKQRLDKQYNALAFQGFIAKLGNRQRVVSTGVGDLVYVTTFEGQVIKVHNRRIPNNPGEIVIVGTDQYSGGRVEVLSIHNVQRSTNDGIVPSVITVPPHTHNYYANPGMVTWVDDAQIMPLNVLPNVGSTTVRVYPGLIRKSSGPGWVAIPSQDVALLSAIPASGAVWVTLQGNDDGTVDYVVGSSTATRALLPITAIPESTTGRPIMHIVLEAGRDTLYRNAYMNDFYDPRFAVGDHAQGVVHNYLYGLQGGSSPSDYYHLSGSQYNALVGGSTTYADLYHTHAIAGSGGGSGATTFLELTDTPAAYTGSGGWVVAVNPGATALTFIDPAWDGNITDIDETSSSEIGEDIATDDQGIIFNTSTSTWVRFLWSRVKTFVLQNLFDGYGGIPDQELLQWDTSTNRIEASGVQSGAIGLVNPLSTPVVSGNLVEWFGTTGHVIDDSGIASADVDSLVDDSILSDLHFHGAFPTEVSITGTATLTSSAFGKIHVCSGTASDYTVTLPAASGNAGQMIHFRMSGALTKLVTLDGNASETIDGSTTRVMWANETATLMCDGSNWVKVWGKTIPMIAAQRASTSQGSIATATITKLTLGTSLIDNTGLCVDTGNSRVYARRAGYWRIHGVFAFAALSGAASNVQCRLHLDGDTSNSIIAIGAAALSGEVAFRPAELPVYSLTKDQYFELYCYHNTGSNESTLDNASFHATLFMTEKPTW